MKDSEGGETFKKVVGRKRKRDVWDELYHLNRFVAKIALSPSDDHGHVIRKVVGKPRAGVEDVEKREA